MKKVESRFRRVITKFGQLPFLMIVIWLIGYAGVAYAPGPWQENIMQMLKDIIMPDGGMLWYNVNAITVFVLLLASLFLSYAIGAIIKLVYHKPRPKPRVCKTWLQKLDASSFPSIHTANSLICAFFGIMMIIIGGWLEDILLAIFSIICWFLFFLSVSLSRIALQQHYPLDILAGSIFAIVILAGVIVFETYIMQLFIRIIYLIW